MEAKETKLKCGDIVQLKGGGPLMTVKKVIENTDLILCNGFSTNGHAFEHEFRLLQLNKK